MVVRKRLELSGPAMAFVTTTIRNWNPIFADDNLARMALEQLRETLAFYKVLVAAFVLMPSHLHALLGFKKIEELSKVIQSFKGLTAKKLRPIMPQNKFPNFYQGEQFNLWRPRFDELIVWSEKQFNVKINYIHNNPVKAGLCDLAVDFRYSSAADWIKGENGIIRVDKNWSWQET